MRCKAGEASAARLARSGVGSFTMRCKSAKMVVSPSRSKGVLRVSISNSTTPREKMSERPSSGCPSTCSGDMYLGEPSTMPVWVMEDDAM